MFAGQTISRDRHGFLFCLYFVLPSYQPPVCFQWLLFQLPESDILPRLSVCWCSYEAESLISVVVCVCGLWEAGCEQVFSTVGTGNRSCVSLIVRWDETKLISLRLSLHGCLIGRKQKSKLIMEIPVNSGDLHLWSSFMLLKEKSINKFVYDV